MAKLLFTSSGTRVQERRALPSAGVAQRIQSAADIGSVVAVLGLQGLDIPNTPGSPKALLL